MFNKKLIKEYNDITFVARDEFIFEATQEPVPAKSLLPEWYKNLPPYSSKTPHFEESHGNQNSTFKQCMPFIDSWTLGYLMLTPCDVFVEKNFDGSSVNIYTHKMFDLVLTRGPARSNSLPIPPDYYQTEFTWMTHWEAQTPKGYSSIYTHPINRPELPFYTISGVMDTDKWYVTGNHPFIIKKGFEGIIPLGTPMASIIPFRRENWRSDKRSMDKMEHDIIQSKVRRHSSGGYKKECWSKKEFS
jgi:hypothetical protein